MKSSLTKITSLECIRAIKCYLSLHAYLFSDKPGPIKYKKENEWTHVLTFSN